MNMKTMIPAVLLAIAPTLGAEAQSKSGLDLTNLDKTVRPADDFYQFATGGWQKLHPLPAAYSRFGSFDMLQDDNNKRINSILSDLQKKKYKKGTTEWKLATFYKQALDVDSRNKAGIAPVKPLLDEMEAAKTISDLQQLQLKSMPMGYGVQYAWFFDADQKNAKMNILNIYQSGLTLGQKDYYVNNDSATVAIRNAYRQHIARMFQLYGFTKEQAETRAAAVFRTETMVALISKSQTELRDPQANYTKMTLKEFNENYPNLRLAALTNAEGIQAQYIDSMVVGQPSFLAGLDKIVSLYTADELCRLSER